MFCCPHYSQLITILLGIVAPDSATRTSFNITGYYVKVRLVPNSTEAEEMTTDMARLKICSCDKKVTPNAPIFYSLGRQNLQFLLSSQSRFKTVWIKNL